MSCVQQAISPHAVAKRHADMTDAPEPPPTEQGLHPAAADFIAGAHVPASRTALQGKPLVREIPANGKEERGRQVCTDQGTCNPPPTVVPAYKLAGGIAGAAGVLAGQPLDTVRIRLQQPGCPWASAGAALRATVAREGPAALFRGVTYPLATISFQVAF